MTEIVSYCLFAIGIILIGAAFHDLGRRVEWLEVEVKKLEAKLKTRRPNDG